MDTNYSHVTDAHGEAQRGLRDKGKSQHATQVSATFLVSCFSTQRLGKRFFHSLPPYPRDMLLPPGPAQPGLVIVPRGVGEGLCLSRFLNTCGLTRDVSLGAGRHFLWDSPGVAGHG